MAGLRGLPAVDAPGSVYKEGAAASPIRRPRDPTARALQFTAAMMFASLVLQRFGVPIGPKAFSLVGPVGLAIGVAALLRGTLAFSRFRLTCFVALAMFAFAGLAWHAVTPAGGLQGEPSTQSMSQFLLLTSFAVLTFAEPVEEKRFFRVVIAWLAAIALAGVVQFFVQFAGISIFSFAGIVPEMFLFEFGYNLQIPAGIGEAFKSNGFFLIEPSTFSQVMALALICEILAFRRLAYLALFAVALLLSFSGTGWIVLGSFLVAATLGMGWRGIMMAAGTVILLVALLGVGSYLAPSAVAGLQGRVNEFSIPGSSGHRRFITPFWALEDAVTARPATIVVGLGAGVSERLPLPYEYDVNTPIKVALDYGFPALLAYILLFVGGRKSPIQAGLVVPACTLFFFAGGYQQFPPVLFLILLLISVARLRDYAATPVVAGERAIASS